MKLNSIKNLFEYKDRSYEQVDKILLSNIDKFQGLGLPDVCVIVKKLPKSILHYNQEQVSSFHLVQGLCPQSQAEVLAYIQTLLQNQETSDQKNIFSLSNIISKISYYIYDIFSKTILVCQFELLPNAQSKIKIFGVQDKQQYTLLTKSHWEGAYVSNLLRALDPEMKIPNVGRFFNNINLQNDKKITEVVTTLLRQISLSTSNFFNLEVIQQNQQFPDFDDIIYYLQWPIYIMFKHLQRTSQIIILINLLDEIEDNLIFYLIKSILYCKMKNYEKALEYLTSPLVSKQKLSLIKYMISRVLIKLKRYEESFLLLKDLLVKGYENQVIWITLAKIFRKLNNYQITFYLLNQASKLNYNQTLQLERNEINLQNYKLLSQCDNIKEVNDLDEIFEVVYPMQANKLESFSQLSSHPILEKILLRQRKIDKKDLKNKKKILQRYMQNPQIQVNDQVIQAIQKYEQMEKNEPQLIKKEAIKLVNLLGCAKVYKYLLLYFYRPMQTFQNENYQELDISQFQIKMKKDIQQKQPKLENQSLILDSDSDEEDYPDFLKQKLNKTFDFSTTSLTNCQTPQSKLNASPIKFTQKAKPKEQISNTYQVIQETAFESLESERNIVHKGMIKSLHFLAYGKTPIGPSSQNQPQQKIKMYGWQDYFNLNEEQKKVFDDQLRRKKEIINPALSEVFQNIFSVSIEFDQLFHPQSQKINKSVFETLNQSQNHSPKAKQSQKKIFKSQLQQSLKTKQHLQKPIEIRDFYITHATCFEKIDEKIYDHIIKVESIFLYKVVRIALQMKKKELANQVLQKINQNTISVQISQLLFELNFDNHIHLIQTIKQILIDFEVCGINQVTFVPIWIENYIIKLTRQMGTNYVFGLLTHLDNGQIFKMLKQIILRAEDLQ